MDALILSQDDLDAFTGQAAAKTRHNLFNLSHDFQSAAAVTLDDFQTDTVLPIYCGKVKRVTISDFSPAHHIADTNRSPVSIQADNSLLNIGPGTEEFINDNDKFAVLIFIISRRNREISLLNRGRDILKCQTQDF